MTRRRLVHLALLLLVFATAYLLQLGCEGIEIPEPDKNKEPETELTGAPAESSAAFYRVHLFWKGFDSDGMIQGFEYALDDTTREELWVFTNKTDSLFVFNTATDESQLQIRDHRFFVRAIDNQGKEDPSPSSISFLAQTEAQPRSILLADTATRIAVQGKTVFAAGGENGLDVLDIGDPTGIKRKTTFFTGGFATDLVLDGDYLYLADGPEGVGVFDVSDPDHVSRVASYPTLGQAAGALAFRDPYLFVADGANGIVVLDVSVPEDPVFFARFRLTNRIFTGVAVREDLVYAAAGDDGVMVLRFRPTEDELILLPLPAQDALPRSTGNTVSSFHAEEGILYVADGSGGLLVFEVGIDGSLIEGRRLPLQGEALQIIGRDERLYVANGSGGVAVVDVSDPLEPELADRLGYSGVVTGVAFAGDDTLVVGRRNRGLSLVDMGEAAGLDSIPMPQVSFCPQSPAERETLLAYSSVKFCWSGVSPGGQVVAFRYQLQGVDVRQLVVAPDSFTVLYQNLPPKDLYIFSVETKDETGLWSSGEGIAERRFTVNYDPETILDSIWVTGPYTDAGPIPLTAVDTLLPDSSYIHFCWRHTDKDTVQGDSVVGSWWRVGGDFFSPDSLEDELVSCDQAGPLISAISGYVLEVGGIDSYGRRESKGATFRFQVNHPPDVEILFPQVNQTVNVRDTLTVSFRGIDVDGPPIELEYDYDFRTYPGNGFISDGTGISGVIGTPDGLMELRMPTFGTRGRVILTISPVDRNGRGKDGPVRSVIFFLNY